MAGHDHVRRDRALTALEKRFDLVGVIVLGAVTAVGGGSVRDLVVGEVSPPALRDEPLLWAIVATSLLVFGLHRHAAHDPACAVPGGRPLRLGCSHRRGRGLPAVAGPLPALAIGGIITVAVRLASRLLGLSVPAPGSPSGPPA